MQRIRRDAHQLCSCRLVPALSAGQGGKSEPQEERILGGLLDARIIWTSVDVAGEPGTRQRRFRLLGSESEIPHLHQEAVVLRPTMRCILPKQRDAGGDQRVGRRAGVGQRLVEPDVVFEGLGHAEANSLGEDLIAQALASTARKDRTLQNRGQTPESIGATDLHAMQVEHRIVLHHEQATRDAPERLVRGRDDDIDEAPGEVVRVGEDAAAPRDEPRGMRDVVHDVAGNAGLRHRLVSDLADPPTVDRGDEGRSADDEHPRLMSQHQITHLVVVDLTRARGPVVSPVVELAGERNGRTVRKVAAVEQLQTEHIGTRFGESGPDLEVGVGAGVRLHTGPGLTELSEPEGGERTVDGCQLHAIVAFRASVVARGRGAVDAITGPGVREALGVLSREHVARGFDHDRPGVRLAGDQLRTFFDAVFLALKGSEEIRRKKSEISGMNESTHETHSLMLDTPAVAGHGSG